MESRRKLTELKNVKTKQKAKQLDNLGVAKKEGATKDQVEVEYEDQERSIKVVQGRQNIGYIVTQYFD